jgi:hypothetical protein
MPKTKISEFSATPANNTDIDSINIAEGCAPSGINDAIRELMAQLKDFQTGAVGDSFNGPVGTSTAAAGAFTTLSASSTVSGTGFSTYLASPPAIGGTAAAAGAFTTLAASGAVTLSGGTANGVAYLNGSKVVTSGSNLTYDATNIALKVSNGTQGFVLGVGGEAMIGSDASTYYYGAGWGGAPAVNFQFGSTGTTYQRWLAGGSEQMRLTSTGLGIGTSSPSSYSAKLAVFDGDFALAKEFSGAKIKWFSTISGVSENAFIQSVSDGITTTTGQILFGTRNTGGTLAERMRLDKDGNLGLGVTPSAWNSAYKVFQFGRDAAIWGQTTDASTVYSSNAFLDSGGGFKYISTDFASYYAQTNSVHSWAVAPSGTAGNAITFTQAMTLDASGRLLVGRTSSDSNGYFLQLNGTSGSQAGMLMTYAGVGSAAIWENSSGALVFGNDGASGTTERARIDSSGNLLVGTTTQRNSAKFTISYAGSANNGLAFIDTADQSSTEYLSFHNSAGTKIGGVNRVTTTNAVVFATTSDQRLKSNIEDANPILEKLMTVKVRQYDWTEGALHQDYGFIAQELEPVLSGVVSKGKAESDMWQMDYSRLTPHLVKAIQEQQAIIESLKARLDAANL